MANKHVLYVKAIREKERERELSAQIICYDKHNVSDLDQSPKFISILNSPFLRQDKLSLCECVLQLVVEFKFISGVN